MAIQSTTLLIVIMTVIGMLSGCSSLTRNPVPIEKIEKATTPGYTDIRAWAGDFSEAFQDDIMLSIKQESRDDYAIT
jgi:hypothetical protein